jgi:excisionase family DNA binding protein
MDRQAITVDEASRAGGPKRAKLYDDIRRGRLRAVKFGRSTRILISDFQKYLTSAPAIVPTAGEPDEKPKDRGRRRGPQQHSA